MAALQFGLQCLQTGLDLGNVLLAAFAALAFVGRAVNEDESGRNLLLIAGIAEGVTQHGQFIMIARQGRMVLTTAALLDGQKAGVVPMQLVGVGVVDGPVVLPRGGAHGGIAVAV